MRTIKHRLDLVFLWLFIPLSLLMMIAMPVTRTPDEPSHLRQAYLIADGQLISSFTSGTVSIPENWDLPHGGNEFSYSDLYQAKDIFLSDRSIQMETNAATAIYPPISYFPQALGMWIAMLFTDNLLIILYSARMINWLCVTLLLYAAIRMLPANRMLFLFLALLPMNLQQIISASADGLAIALVYALAAFVMHCMEKKPAFTWQHYLTALLLAIGVCSWKVFYTPMIFLLLFIPSTCFGSSSKKKIGMGCILGTSLLLLAGWALICFLTMFKGSESGLTGQTMSGISTFLHNPLNFLVKLFAALKSNLPGYISGIFGYKHSMSWFNVTPGIFLTAASICTLLLFFFADDTRTWQPKYRIASLGLSVVCILLSFLLLYLWWTPAESPRIEGFQSRYVLPLLFPMGIAVWQMPKHRINNRLVLLALVVLVDLGYIWQIFTQIA